MNPLKKVFLYCGLDREEYQGIRQLIRERNYSFSNIISIAMMVFGALFILFRSKDQVLFPYLVLMGSGVLFFLVRQIGMRKAGRFSLLYRYLQLAVIFVFAMILSTEGINREMPSTTIIVFLALLPLTINDRPLRMWIFVAVFSGVYLIISGYYKVWDAHRADVMNTMTFSAVGMAVYLLISNRNVQEIYLRQKAAESDRLREEKAAAEMANAAKSEFLANMSHEIRTPINAVLGMNEMILRESMQAREQLPEDPEEVRSVFGAIGRYAGSIESAGSNLLAIINDTLDLSRIEAGRMEITECSYRLSAILNEICGMIAFKTEAKNLAFRVKVDRKLPDSLFGDEVHVRQIIINVLNNAVKYTREGSVILTVRKEPEAQVRAGEPLEIVISVKDTGIGIREEDISKIFVKFERLDLQQNSSVEGTGLGLAITHRLLEMMGGSISVESEYGAGSEFTIRLPQRVESTEPVEYAVKQREAGRGKKEYTESFRAPEARILVVDDTQTNLTIVRGLLRKTLMTIDTAISGPDGIALAAQNRYDLVLMDQRMPGMDGIETMHRIRELESGLNRDTPFICLTADVVSGARERYLAEGFAGYLTKPVNSRLLEKTIMKHLPQEKVQPARGRKDAADAAEEERGKEAEDPAWSLLREAGIEPEKGLAFCDGDSGFYRTLLREVAQAAPQKAEDLQRFLDAQDWKNYGILAHSLKSTFRTIGADGLSAAAALQDKAVKAGDGDAVRAGHAALTAGYEKAAAAVLKAYPLPGPDGGENGRDPA